MSRSESTDNALDRALESIHDRLPGGSVDLLIATYTFHHAEMAERIAARLTHDLSPRAFIATTAGGVSGQGVEVEGEHGLSLLAAKLPGSALNTFTYNDLDWPASADSPHVLRSAMLGEPDAESPDVILAFADPFSVPMSKLLPAIDKATGGAPVIGGMCSGSLEPNGNRLTIDGRVLNQGAVGVSVTGGVSVDTTVSQGCRPIGEPHVITEAQNNLIKTLGNRPVMEVIQETAQQLDEANRRLMQQGLLVGRVIDEYKDRFGRGDFVIRNVIGVGREQEFIAVSDLLKVGQTVQFHVRDRRTAEEDLQLLLDAQAMHGEPAGVFLCTCNGRGIGLFDSPDYESQIIRQRLGDTPMTGMFAAGEIGPVGRRNFVHGFTASMAIFR